MNKFKKLLISALACCSFGLAAMASVANANNEPVMTHAGDAIAAPVMTYHEPTGSGYGTVSITAEAGTIYYTTNGTNPNASSTKYTTPITVTSTNFTIKAVAINGGKMSEVVTGVFPPAKEVKLSEIMANYPDFPTTQETGWSNGTRRMWYEPTVGGMSALKVNKGTDLKLIVASSTVLFTECEGGYNSPHTDKIVKLNFTDNVLTSIFFDDYSESDYCGLYEPVAPKMTIGEVLNTVPGGFPTSLNDFIPGDAWRNENNKAAYIYYGTDFVFGVMLQEWVSFPLSFELESSGNTYTWTNENGLTVKFNMEDSVLTSIELVENPTFPELNGIYTPSDSSIHSVSDVIATYDGFPSTRDGDDTWLNGENVCYFSDELCLFDGYVEYSVPGGADVTKVGDNYTLDSYGTLVFEMLDGKLNAITYTTEELAYERLVGTYKVAYKINFVVNDPTMGILSAEHQRATEGTQVRLFIHPNQGYYFDRVEGDYEGFEVLDGEYNSKYFVMPGHEVTLTGYFASATITSITMKSNPTKTEYLVGEELDLTGAQITVTTEGGATADLDVTIDMVSGFDSSIIGEQTITVTFEGKTTSFTVTVISADDPNNNKQGLHPGAVAGITIGSILGFFIILFAVLYILWKLKDINVPFIKKFLTPAFRWITNLLFKTKLNNVEKKDAEEKQMSEEDYLKALKEGTLNK